MPLIVEDISKSFTDFAALKHISFEARPGEFLALLGPSGSGKTTLLRLIAGLDKPDSGRLWFDGRDYLTLAPKDRGIGMVFQSYALFRHMTVEQNIAFGLSVKKGRDRPLGSHIKKRVSELLELMQLNGLNDRYPSQLSGGQRQRVALARALAIDPKLLLLDEPFGALDALVRKDLRRWLRHIHDQSGVTTLLVTHDQEEALDLADRVIVLNRGEIEQSGTPHALYNQPRTEFVFDFLGSGNRMIGMIDGKQARFDGHDCPVFIPEGINPRQGYRAIVRFRPHECTLTPQGPGHACKIRAILKAGPNLRVELTDAEGQIFEVHLNHDHLDLAIDQIHYVRPSHGYVFETNPI
jgi:sulfate transport system ATP-binding protein